MSHRSRKYCRSIAVDDVARRSACQLFLNLAYACGHDFHAAQTCSECGEMVDARSVETRPGPGAAE